jgi:hypothetical protein
MRAESSRRGNYTVIVGLLSLSLIGFGALAIDFFRLRVADGQAQMVADAAATAALIKFRSTGSTADAEVAASQIVEANIVAEHRGGMEVQFTWGKWDWDQPRASAWTPGGTPVNAVQTSTGRSNTSSAGEVELFLGPAIGRDSQAVWGTSVAALRYREMMVVLDVTHSFTPAFPDVQVGLQAFLDQLNLIAMPGDQVGLVTFTAAAPSTAFTPLQSVISNYAAIGAQWGTLETCDLWIDNYANYYQYTETSPGVPMTIAFFNATLANQAPTMIACSAGNELPPTSYTATDMLSSGAKPLWKEAGTSPGHGIEAAAAELASSGDVHATKVIILITDGNAECVSEPGSCVEYRQDYGVAAADAAYNGEGISIYSVSYNLAGDLDQTEYAASLTRGFGKFYETPTASELADILVDIAKHVPTGVVR